MEEFVQVERVVVVTKTRRVAMMKRKVWLYKIILAELKSLSR
jgi:hypothetical protein